MHSKTEPTLRRSDFEIRSPLSEMGGHSNMGTPATPGSRRFASSMCCMLALLALGMVFGTGCGIGKPEGASFASVTIKGHTPEEIAQATGVVFQEDGFMVGSLLPSQMVFQKEGSRGQSLAYGGVVDTHYGSKTMVRVRANVVDLGSNGQRLQCQAYMVRNAGESVFEDETRLMNIHGGKYQGLLNKVAKNLK